MGSWLSNCFRYCKVLTRDDIQLPQYPEIRRLVGSNASLRRVVESPFVKPFFASTLQNMTLPNKIHRRHYVRPKTPLLFPSTLQQPFSTFSIHLRCACAKVSLY